MARNVISNTGLKKIFNLMKNKLDSKKDITEPMRGYLYDTKLDSYFKPGYEVSLRRYERIVICCITSAEFKIEMPSDQYIDLGKLTDTLSPSGNFTSACNYGSLEVFSNILRFNNFSGGKIPTGTMIEGQIVYISK